MIKLSRQIDPDNFPSTFHGEQRKELELELLFQARELRNKEIEKVKFKSGRWKSAKPILLDESFDKCAYCEVFFTTVAYGDVEHYRPKSKYYWLAYSYFNYSASCQLCNQKYKGANFPIQNKKLKKPAVRKNNTDEYLKRAAGKYTVDPIAEDEGLPLPTFIENHHKERPRSVDPYLDNPEEYFAYRFNDLTREVMIEALNKDVKKIANSSIKLFGLNRKELRDLRYRGLLNYRFFRQIISQLGTDSPQGKAARNLINEQYINPRAEFAGMYTFFEKGDIAVLP